MSGASLREVAAALNLSHQRIHQIVETASGGRRWGRDRQVPPELACTFCGRARHKVRKLIAGPRVYICERCVATAEAVIASGCPAETLLGPLESVPEGMTGPRCSFCGKSRQQAAGLAVSVGNRAGWPASDAAICAECLDLCREIHREEGTIRPG